MRVLITGSESFYGYYLSAAATNFGFEVVSFNLDPTESFEALVERIKEINVDAAILAAGWSFGIQGNLSTPASLSFNNLDQLILLKACALAGVELLTYLGSSCMYPEALDRSLSPEDMLTGPLEQSSQDYALVKLCGAGLCDAVSREFGYGYFSIIPSNVYGPRDEYGGDRMHVVNALCDRALDTRQRGERSLKCGGSGRPIRDFLFVTDFAEAVMRLIQNGTLKSVIVNIGSGMGTSISNLAAIIAQSADLTEGVFFDVSIPDGARYKVLNSDFIRKLGWTPKVSLEDGIKETMAWIKMKRNGEL
jgi:GDP-L-fucose synthase